MTQQEALDILKTGASVFLTGEPGSGKTHTVNTYVAWLRQHNIRPAVTASTGIAATHIGGMTIHSWSGIGVRRNLSQRDLGAIMANRRVAKRIEGATVLIIDEISMLAASTLTMVETVCRHVRGKQAPFGALQVVLVGDFFQLPPVVSKVESPIVRREENGSASLTTGDSSGAVRLGFGEDMSENAKAPYAFRSPAWKGARLTTCYLSEQYRQEDEAYLQVLAMVRNGTPDAFIEETLGTRRTAVSAAPRDLPKLYAHNIDVDRVNTQRLAGISGNAHAFEMIHRGPEALIASLKRGCLSPETLLLKIGARVMFTKNNPDGSFVNGTLGEVEKFDDDGNPIVRTLRGRRVHAEPMEWTIVDGARSLAQITQVPLRLAWALTIHKSQGMTLDAAVMDLSQTFEYGQGYVALSRVRSLKGLHLLGWNARALEVHPDIRAEDQNFKLQSEEGRKTFGAVPSVERGRRVRDFISACGGSVYSVAAQEKGKDALHGSTLEKTLALFKDGKSVSEIAHARGLAASTIFSHLFDLHAGGRIGREELACLVSPALRLALPTIHAVFKKLGTERLGPVFARFNGTHSYDDLRLARMLMEQ